MQTTINVERRLIAGYHNPVSRATITVGKLLSPDQMHASIGDLRQNLKPVKDEISMVVRRHWHDSYSFECFKTIKDNKQYFCFSCSIESSLNDKENLDSIVSQIVSDLQRT